jgi:hypothetical protein
MSITDMARQRRESILAEQQGGSSGSHPNNSFGINQGYLNTTTTTTPGLSSYEGGNAAPGQQYWIREPQTTSQTTYNGPGGYFTQEGNAWRGAGGQMIGDLPGYLEMRDRMKSGSDFSVYQNQLQGLLNNPSSIQNDPSYQFRLGQGNQAINRSAAAKGMLGSGNVLAELAKYGQGMASQEYDNQFNRLSDLMKNSQQFGIGSGYYTPPGTTQTVPGAVPVTRPSVW